MPNDSACRTSSPRQSCRTRPSTWKRWNEVALWWPQTRTLVVAEALGTNRFFTGGDPLGVHFLMRLHPPRAQLGVFAPEHLVVGHGEGLHEDSAASELQAALAGSRRSMPKLAATTVPLLVDAIRRRV